MKPRIHIAPIVAFCLFLVGVAPLAYGDTPQVRAADFITELTNTAIRELTDPDLSQGVQEQRFRRIIHDHVAVKSIARWVLGGRQWRRASEEQRLKYVALFGDLMIATYSHRFQSYAGEELVIEGTQSIDKTQTLVRSTMLRPGSDRAIKIDWRVRETDGQLRVIDVMVEGLSLAQTQRSEFTSFLRANGQSIDALIANLEERLHDVRNGRVADASEKQ